MADRSSQADEPNLIREPIPLAEKEAENAIAQYDWAMEQLGDWIARGTPALRMSVVLDLHRIALKDIHPYAGNFRPAGVSIKGSKHQPIASQDVPRYVEEMLEYVERNWAEKTAIHLASYVLWRLNWIHPFSDGNGRTARILSYMVLCAKLGIRLPGSNTIPEQISEDKRPYYIALEEADRYFKNGRIDLSEMEQLLEACLAAQLLEIHDGATGKRSAEETFQTGSVGAQSQPERLHKEGKSKNSIVAHVESHPVIYTSMVVLAAAILGIIFTN